MSVRVHEVLSHRKEAWNVSGLSRELQAIWNAVLQEGRAKADQAAVAPAAGQRRRSQFPFCAPARPAGGERGVAFAAPFGRRRAAAV